MATERPRGRIAAPAHKVQPVLGERFSVMAARFTRRRTLVVLAVFLILGVLAGSVALRANRTAADAPGGSRSPPVALEFAAADLAYVEPKALTRWLPLSGTLQPVDQTTVKAKVSGEIRQVAVREGEAVKAGQVIARFDTADLEAKLTDRIGALESSRAQLAMAEKTRAQNQQLLKQKFISQNAYDSAESNLSVSQGTLKSNEAQAQLARNALRDAIVTAPLSGIVAKRHVQPGEKVSFDAPLVTVVDLAQMELRAMVPANDIPELVVKHPWLRGTQVLTSVVTKHFSPDGAELLHQPDLLVHFQTQLQGMPEFNLPIIHDIQKSLGEVRPLVDVGSSHISPESVRKINEITTRLDNGIVTRD